MSCKITVIARVGEGGAWLARLVNSLDTQDLPYREFGVVFLVPDRGAGAGQRLTELAGRRPNVSVVAQAEDPAILAEAVTGAWVLDLGTGLEASKPVLFPQALSRLVALGTAHDCQAVLGRAVAASGDVVDDLFVTDRPRLDGGATVLTASGPAVMLRRDLALARGLARPRDTEEWLAGLRDVGVLGTYPTMLVAPVQPAAGAAIEVRESAADWRDGRIIVTVTAPAGDAGGREVLFAVRQQGSGLEYWLPGMTTGRSDGTLAGTAEIDVRTAALGAPLADGIWTVSAGVTGDRAGRHVRSPLPRTPLAPGIADGVLVVPAQAGAALALDIGATRSSVVPRLSLADVSIGESARGTLMTIRLDRLAVHGDARIPGSLHLGEFPLPASLVAAGGRARIECFVSGLAGTSALSARFGPGKPVPTGLNLEISPTGIMTVAPGPAKSVTTPGPARPQAKVAAESTVVRLRHSVPAPIEPAVRFLARNKLAARAYRALANGRSQRR